MSKTSSQVTLSQSAFSPFELKLDLLRRLQEGEKWVINPRRKNGLIVYKRYHGEFAGPGSIIGGRFDLDVVDLMMVGRLSLIQASPSEKHQRAYLIRRQWSKLLSRILDNPDPVQRAQVILNQFEHWFDPQTASQLPDYAFAYLIGVLPQTIAQVRKLANRDPENL